MSIERAAATADDTLDQTSDTLIVGMSITPPSATYQLFFTCTFRIGTAGSEVNTFSVYVGGVQIDHSEREYQENTSIDNSQLPMVCSCEVSPDGSEAVEIRHRTENAASPLIAEKRELNLFPHPVAGTPVEVSATADDTITGATFATMVGMSTTPVAGDYWLVFSASWQATTNNSIITAQVTVGGTIVDYSLRLFENEASWSQSEFPVLIAIKISPDGSELVEIEWNRTAGGTATVHERTMNLIPVAAGDIFEATATAGDTDNTTTDKQIDNMLITNPGAADYIVLFSAHDFYGSVAQNNTAETQYSMRNGSSRVTDSERVHEHEGSIDSSDVPVMAGGKVTVSGTDDLAMWWQNVTDTLARTINERTLLAVREAAAAAPVDLPILLMAPIAPAERRL